MKKRVLVVVILITSIRAVAAGGNLDIPPSGQQDTLFASVRFPIGRNSVNPFIDDNRSEIDRVVDSLTVFLATGRPVSRVVVTGKTSPDGKESANRVVSRRRAQVVAGLLSSHVSLLPLEKIEVVGEGDNWQGLRTMVEASDMEWKKEVLAILDSIPERERRKNRLMFLAGGAPWNYMYEHFFPRLRVADIHIFFDPETDNLVSGASQEVPPLSDTTAFDALPSGSMKQDSVTSAQGFSQAAAAGVQRDNAPRWALKTNTLYWVALLPNIEVEYYVGRRLSVNLEYQAAWWGDKGKNRFYRLVAASPEVRFWFRQKERFHGHFAGAYANGGIYEFMGGPSKGVQGDYFAGGGFSYGYVLPIGRRLSLEFSVSAGYVATRYKQYHYDNGCYVCESTKEVSYFGPTKAKVGLVWRLGGEINSKR